MQEDRALADSITPPISPYDVGSGQSVLVTGGAGYIGSRLGAYVDDCGLAVPLSGGVHMAIQPIKFTEFGHAEGNVNGSAGAASDRTFISDLFGRASVQADLERNSAVMAGRRVLITGAAGSIGRELVRQVSQLGPEIIFGLDMNESDLYDLSYEISSLGGASEFRPVVANITNHAAIRAILRRSQVDVIFHAAAYKHVPLMEEYPTEAVTVNAIASYHLARSAAAEGVQRLVLVSTDKAVRPTSVMGASKRLAELLIRSVSVETGLSACAVRFGNVFASRGSVIPLFERQIAAGGPITITHPDMKRYFMTIGEAAGLIIQAGAFGDDHVIYMLDMGEEVAIKDVAMDLIRMHGLRVGTDIEITYIGTRPGEKLSESLSLDYELAYPTSHPKIRILREGSDAPTRGYDPSKLLAWLGSVCADEEPENVRAAIHHAICVVDDSIAPPVSELEPVMPAGTYFRPSI